MASQCWVPGRTTDAVRYCDGAGNATLIPVSLAILAAVLDRLGRYEPAATIAGFAVGAMTERVFPEFTAAIAHLRNVLGERPTNSSPARAKA
jgi:hypothetical protein